MLSHEVALEVAV